jgi:anti-sigma regulatory factor (Ser/Thr protein kinase)
MHDQATRLTLRLDRGPQAVAAARSALDALAVHLTDTQLDDIRLLVSELVTNSVRHASDGDEVRIEIDVDTDCVRAAVIDEGPGFETTARTADSDIGSGWGLYLVDHLADRWGVESEDLTRVWFELDRPLQSVA